MPMQPVRTCWTFPAEIRRLDSLAGEYLPERTKTQAPLARQGHKRLIMRRLGLANHYRGAQGCPQS